MLNIMFIIIVHKHFYIELSNYLIPGWNVQYQELMIVCIASIVHFKIIAIAY